VADLLRIQKVVLMRELHRSHPLSDDFISYLIGRNVRVEEALIDQLFNSTEKRLARALLLLARYGKKGKSEAVIPQVSQTMLAEMIGTSRPRVSIFMNKFRNLGFIDYDYNGALQVNSSLLNIVLHD
jgi:CRP-like cAMP-binding protein